MGSPRHRGHSRGIVVGLESTGDGRDYRQDTTFARAHSSQSQASQELAWAALHGLRSSLVKERISEPVNDRVKEPVNDRVKEPVNDRGCGQRHLSVTPGRQQDDYSHERVGC